MLYFPTNEKEIKKGVEGDAGACIQEERSLFEIMQKKSS